MARPKGFKHKKETIERMKKNHKGFLGFKHTEEEKRKIGEKSKSRKPMLGKKHSEKTKKDMSLRRLGIGNSNWKGGLTLSVRFFRKSRQYQEWRSYILERDNYSCIICKKRSHIVHHKLSVKDYPELRLIIENGEVLCEEHHKEKHKK